MKIVNKIFSIYEASIKEYIKDKYKVTDADFEKTDPKHCVCSIAKTKEGYVGFSHRACCEFKKGNKIFEPEWRGDHTEEEVEKMDFVDRGEKKIANEADAKKAASNFAEYVS